MITIKIVGFYCQKVSLSFEMKQKGKSTFLQQHEGANKQCHCETWSIEVALGIFRASVE